VLTVLATIVLLLKFGPISQLGESAATVSSSAHSAGLRMSVLVHAVGGLLVLLAATTLAVYKPGGLTAYGRRMAIDRLDRPVSPATPPWVKAFALAAGLLLLMTIFMMVSGGHGPRS
jgi:hypothetical protein